jgi:hypothetical protein
MVKFGGVRNYIVATWDPDDLQACIDLNLPCADVTSLLPVKLEEAANPNAHDELVGISVLVVMLLIKKDLTWTGFNSGHQVDAHNLDRESRQTTLRCHLQWCVAALC